MVALAAPIQAETYNGYEIPDYTVVSQTGNIEIRDYASFTEAHVTREGARFSAAGSGFRALANYIFGGNRNGTKLAMTAPVIQQPSGNGWQISFVLPSNVTPATAPTPNAADVQVSERPAKRMAVIQFSGTWTQGRIQNYQNQLLMALRDRGLRAKGDPIYMFYNDPMTLPWKRRNEIAFEIAGY